MCAGQVCEHPAPQIPQQSFCCVLSGLARHNQNQREGLCGLAHLGAGAPKFELRGLPVTSRDCSATERRLATHRRRSMAAASCSMQFRCPLYLDQAKAPLDRKLLHAVQVPVVS